jgi:hypothetical protein
MKSSFLKKGFVNIPVILFSVLIVSTFYSCSKEDKNSDTGMTDNYYVKYVIKGNGAYGRFSNWTATTPQGIYTNSGYQTTSWNQTYGPVKKGFKCEVQIGNFISGAPTIEIHVSKNSEPFSLKITNTGSSATYTIN